MKKYNFYSKNQFIFLLSLLLVSCGSSNVINNNFNNALSNNIKIESYNTNAPTYYGYYKVKKGDNLHFIAFSVGRNMQEILDINNISKNFILYEGDLLSLEWNKKPKFITRKTTRGRVKSSTTINKNKIIPKKNNNYKKPKTKAKPKPKLYSNKKIYWSYPAIGNKKNVTKHNHKGLYISNIKNKNIKAAANGKVVFVGQNIKNFGNMIMIEHNNDYISVYAYNDVIKVKEGQFVKRGETISIVSNQRILLFIITYKGKSIDPKSKIH